MLMLNLCLFQIKAEKLKKLKMVEKVHSVVLYSGKKDRKQNRRQTGLVVFVVFVVSCRPLGWSMPAETGNVSVMEIIASAGSLLEHLHLVPGYVRDIIQC